MNTYVWALYGREVKRFQKLWLDTIFSPIVSIVLFLSVFGIVAGSKIIGDISFTTFVYAGLLAMLLVNSSFSNPGFALIIAKNVGNIIDLQLVPIKPWAIGIAYSLAATTRAIITLVVAAMVTVWFIPKVGLIHPLYFLLSIIITGLEFGMLGVVFGMWAKSFESLTFMTTFVMQPMIFLAGVFYPISSLPYPWSIISIINPIHHNINIFRYAVTGYSDFSPVISLSITLGIGILLFVIMHFTMKKSIKNISFG